MGAGENNSFATAALCRRLQSPRPEVRRAALQALVRVVHRGDSVTVAAVTTLLDHVDPDVQAVALDALGEVGGLGDEEVISRVSARTSDLHADVQSAAAKALEQLSWKPKDEDDAETFGTTLSPKQAAELAKAAGSKRESSGSLLAQTNVAEATIRFADMP